MARGRHTFNLGSWLTRLGIKGGDIPDIAHLVQPVQVVGDASLLVPALLPPSALYGRAVGAVAGEYAGIDILSNAPGGSLLRYFSASLTANASHVWSINSGSGLTFSAATTLFAHEFGTGSMRSVLKAGPCPALQISDANAPTMDSLNYYAFVLLDGLYIPNGYRFQHQCQNVNSLVRYAITLQDLPAGAGPE